MYRLVTGYYPSWNMAEKIQQHLKGKWRNVQIEQVGSFYICVLGITNDYMDAKQKLELLRLKGIGCGIELI